MEGHQHRHEESPGTEGARDGEPEVPPQAARDYRGTQTDASVTDTVPAPEAALTVYVSEMKNICLREAPDVTGVDPVSDLPSPDMESEFLDLPQRQSGRSSPSVIHTFTELSDYNKLTQLSNSDNSDISASSSLKTAVHLSQDFQGLDLPRTEFSDVNIVDVDIIIDHPDDNVEYLPPPAVSPSDLGDSGNVDGSRGCSPRLWINLEPQSHTLLSPRSSAGSISSYRSSNDSAIELLTPDDELVASDHQGWDARSDAAFSNKGAIWDMDASVPQTYSVSSDSGNAITLWSEPLYGESSRQDSDIHLPFSLIGGYKEESPTDPNSGQTKSCGCKGGSFSDTKAAQPSFSDHQFGPFSSSYLKRGPDSSCDSQGGPLSFSDYQGKPLTSLDYEGETVSSSEKGNQHLISDFPETFSPCRPYTSVSSTKTNVVYVPPPSVVISDFSSKVPCEDKGSQTREETRHVFLDQPYLKFRRCLSNSSISSNESSGTSFSVQSDSSVDVEEHTENPPPVKPKQSSWKKIRNIVHWAPFIQKFKRRQYPWIQLAGHQELVQKKEPYIRAAMVNGKLSELLKPSRNPTSE